MYIEDINRFEKKFKRFEGYDTNKKNIQQRYKNQN